MAKYARGSKSKAISDISGFEVPYPKLKTTYDNLRVEPEEFDPKHPQLTPAKNVIDATALFNPRPDNDPENVTILFGFTQNIFASKIEKSQNSVGIPGHARIGGFVASVVQSSEPNASGVAGTGVTGTESLETEIEEAGVAGTGAIGTTTISNNLVESGVSGIGTVGTTTAVPTTYTVTVVSTDSGNKYVINGTQQATLSLIRGNTYIFDWSDSTAQGHPVRFSTTSDGTHNSGSEYTTGVTKDDSAYKTTIVVSGDAPDNLYYYCQIHSGMGGAINVSFTASVTIETSITEVGVAGTGAVGTETPEASIEETGVAGTGAIGTIAQETSITEVGVAGTGATGTESVETDIILTETGVAGTGALGSFTVFSGTNVGVTGVAGTGATGTESIVVDCTITETGVAGTGAVGTETPEASITETGLAGTGAVGTESLELTITETGVAGTGATEGFGVSGNGNVQISVTGTSGVAGTGDIGNEVSSSQVIETGVAGTGATGTESVTVNQEWGSGTWGDGTWGN